MHPTTSRLPLLLLLVTTACAGGGGDGDGDPTLVDAAPGGGDDDPPGGGDDDPPGGGDPPACLAAATYPGFTEPLAFSFTMEGSTTPDVLVLEAALDGAAKPDVVLIQLFKGFGPFAEGEIAPGTFEITGADAQYATCGVCVLVLTDVDPTSGEETGTPYLATSGSVTITSVSPNLTGTVTGLGLTHVEIDAESMSTPAADGCASAIPTASFDAVVMTAPPPTN